MRNFLIYRMPCFYAIIFFIIFACACTNLRDDIKVSLRAYHNLRDYLKSKFR